MSELQPAVRQAIEAEATLFCQAEQAVQLNKGASGRVYSNESLHVRTSNCGIATAFMQQRLREHYDIDTDRLYAEPPLAPRLQYNARTFGHVLLRHEGVLIDPTYGQLFSYVGVQPSRSDLDVSLYPKDLALLVDLAQPETSLGSLAAAMDRAGESDRSAQSEYGPLRGLGRQAISAVLRDIYTPEHYTAYDVSDSDPSHDHVQDLIRRAATLRQ